MPSRKNLAKGCLGCLGVFVVLAVILLPLLYLEEDWRGARELAAAKQRWQDAGYSLNPADYYPPPVPDDQNLAALPVFRLEPDPKDPKHPNWLMDTRLRDALDEGKHGGYLKYRDDPKTGKEVNDLAVNVQASYAKMFPGKTPPASLLVQLEALYPILNELRTAEQTRPAFRMNLDFGNKPPWDLYLGPITDQIHLSKLISYDMQQALRENQPQIAGDDIKVEFQISKGIGTIPALVAGLVSIGDIAIVRSTINDGLTKHEWNDAQLAQIQAALKQVDFLAMFRFDMQTEAVVFSLPMYEYLKKSPSLMNQVTAGVEDSDGQQVVPLLLWRIWATGWWDMNAAKMLNTRLRDLACVELKTHFVEADRHNRLEVELEKAKELPGGAAPWNTLYVISAGPVSAALMHFAQAQAQLDEDRIVCGLERYRLAHGSYPASLDALVPASIDELPHDVMNGEPYHYRLNPDGTFLLYSVGWNQVDDGGTVVYEKDNPKSIDYEKGDWVWPMVRR